MAASSSGIDVNFKERCTSSLNTKSLTSHGQEWNEQRRFTMKTLKDLGFGKTQMEDVILEEVEKLVGILSKG